MLRGTLRKGAFGQQCAFNGQLRQWRMLAIYSSVSPSLTSLPVVVSVLPAGRLVNDGETVLYMASMRHCRSCPLKAHCCPKAPFRRVPRSIYEDARDVARALAKTEAFERSRHDRKRVEMLFAHLKRILRLGRLRLRGPCGAQFEFTLAAIAQNLRRLAMLVARPPPLPVPFVA